MEWRCFKCDYSVRSKCVWERSIFDSHYELGVNVFKSCVSMTNSNTIMIDTTHKAEDCSNEEFLIDLLETLKNNKGLLQMTTCNHQFRLVNGTKCELDHEHS